MTWLALPVLILACATSGGGGTGAGSGDGRGARDTTAASRASEAALGPAARSYVTDPGTKGIVGGTRAVALANEVTAALTVRARAQGSHAAPAEADETLARVAGVLLAEASLPGQGNVDSIDVERIARRAGFAGSILAASVFPLELPPGQTPTKGGVETWREALAPIAPNLPINRFGLHLSADGSAAALIFGDVSLSLQPLPRHVAPGGKLRLEGQLSRRFDFGHAYVTAPDGTVHETPIAGRRIAVDIPLPARGVYRVEVMGDGPAGPTIVLNVPVHVGVAEPEVVLVPPGSAVGESWSVRRFEERMLELLNQARRRAGLAALAADAQLRAVAVAHSLDMQRAHFFGHVSPSTGTVADRLARAGVQVSTAGENLSEATTPEEAHGGLMESPGHRANMLGPKFTHVGIGIVRTDAQPPRFLATLVFARRTRIDQSWTAVDAMAAIAALRKGRGAPPVSMDPGLRAAAQAGIDVFARTSSPAEAATAASAALSHQPKAPASAAAAVCVHFFEILDPDQLSTIPALTEASLRAAGLAMSSRNEAGARKFSILMVTQGGTCQDRH